jgi:hypothetical protein
LQNTPFTLTKENGFLNLKLNQDVSNINLFCLYKISKKKNINENLEFVLPQKIKNDKKYEYCIIFLDVETLKNKIIKAIEEDNHILIGGRSIEYVDKKYHGDMGIFKKFKDYEYQNEFRVAIEANLDKRGEGKEVLLKIGNIKNIANIYKTSELEKFLIVERND